MTGIKSHEFQTRYFYTSDYFFKNSTNYKIRTGVEIYVVDPRSLDGTEGRRSRVELKKRGQAPVLIKTKCVFLSTRRRAGSGKS